jgi:hypothetical protein
MFTWFCRGPRSESSSPTGLVETICSISEANNAACMYVMVTYRVSRCGKRVCVCLFACVCV